MWEYMGADCNGIFDRTWCTDWCCATVWDLPFDEMDQIRQWWMCTTLAYSLIPCYRSYGSYRRTKTHDLSSPITSHHLAGKVLSKTSAKNCGCLWEPHLKSTNLLWESFSWLAPIISGGGHDAMRWRASEGSFLVAGAYGQKRLPMTLVKLRTILIAFGKLKPFQMAWELSSLWYANSVECLAIYDSAVVGVDTGQFSNAPTSKLCLFPSSSAVLKLMLTLWESAAHAGLPAMC